MSLRKPKRYKVSQEELDQKFDILEPFREFLETGEGTPVDTFLRLHLEEMEKEKQSEKKKK